MTEAWIVRKYGGSSLATREQVRHVARRVRDVWTRGHGVVVVVSARGATTDCLLEEARAFSVQHRTREIDQLLATGEVASAATLALALEAIGVPARSMTAAQAGIGACGPHGAGVVEHAGGARLREWVTQNRGVAVVAGFQGMNAAGDVVTLGRGGSDTTAVALAAELGAGACEILTDVSGVYSADPRVVPDARVVPFISLDVMAEMTARGAHVLHAPAVGLALRRGLRLQVRGAFEDGPGTAVCPVAEAPAATPAVTAVTHDDDAACLTLSWPGPWQECADHVLDATSRSGIPFDVSVSAIRGGSRIEVRCGLRASDVPAVLEPLERTAARHGGALRADQQLARVSLVGSLLDPPTHGARMLECLRTAGVRASWTASSQLSISTLVPRVAATRAARALHCEFGLGGTSVAMHRSRPQQEDEFSAVTA